MKKFLSFFLLAFIAMTSYAQTNALVPEARTCGTMEHFHRHTEEHPDLLHHNEVMNQQIADWIEANPNANETRATYTMPIVFHVIYNAANENIPDSLIIAQLDQVNDDFLAMNDDLGTVPDDFPIGNINIEFCLATVDPDGNATSGITRTQTSTASFSTNDAMKFTSSGGIDAWDTNRYFNVWICPMGGGILGYGQFPASFIAEPDTDGLVLGYGTVGSQEIPNPAGGVYGGGRTATHELGHCLGLYHIWGDDGNACTGSDYIVDTPNQGGPSSGCPQPTSSCGSLDMTMNYMDYSYDECLTAFTPGQATRITAMINTNEYLRNKIAASGQVCGAVAPNAAINSGSTFGCVPLSVSFSDNSSGAATTWTWSFPGGDPSSHDGQNPPAVTYATPGEFSATLTVANDLGTHTEVVSVDARVCTDLECNSLDNLNNGNLVTTLNGDDNGAGYVAGHNGYNDSAKAEYFTNLGTATKLNSVEFAFGYAVGTGNVEFVVWADDNGIPGAELATELVPLSTIIANVDVGNRTVVDFGGVLDIPNAFYVGFKLEYGDHEVGLYTNSDGETTTNTSYELWTDGTWQPFDDGTTATWELELSMAIYPNVCTLNQANQPPGVAFSASVEDEGCLTASIQYDDNSSNIPTAWLWSFPGGTPETSTEQNPIVSYTSAGSYSATLTAENANGDNTITQTDIVVVPGLLVLDAALSTDTVDLMTSGLVDFTDNTAGATSWTWDFGDGSATSSDQNPSHTYAAIGTYTVTLTVTDGLCSEVFTATVTVKDTTGVDDIKGLSSMSIHPNPVSDKFFVQLVSSESLELQIDVFDATGRKVAEGGTVNVMGNVNHPIDASQLAAGTYFVRIISGSNTATTKVLKF